MKVRDGLHRHAPPSSKPLVGRFLVRLACAQVLELVFDIRKDAANGWTEENQDPDDDDRDQRDDEGILDQPLTTIPMEQTIQHACSLPPSLHSDVYGPALAVAFGNRTLPFVPTGSGFDPHGPSLPLTGRRFPNVGTYPSRTHVPEGPHAGRLEKVRSQKNRLGLAVAARCWGGGLARIAGLAMGARIIRVAVGACRTVRVAMGAWR